MKKNLVKATIFALAGAFALASPVSAEKAKSLDELLGLVKKGYAQERADHKRREAEFSRARDKQQEMLEEAEELLEQEEERSAELEKTFEDNELLIKDKKAQLADRLGVLTELFGHLTSAAGDLRANMQNSLVSVQYPGRDAFIDELIEKMSAAETLPTIEDMERVWYETQREMTETGRVVKFSTEVTSPGGEKSQGEVVRIGVFNIVSAEGKYLQYIPENGTLQELARQPDSNFLGWAEDLGTASSGVSPAGLDPTGPSGGTFLAALIDSPNLEERWHQGGVVGYIITTVGVIAMLIAIWRLIVLSMMNAKVKSQLKSDKANTNNPLGRVLKVHEDNPSMDAETLELKLSEAVLKELPGIESMLALLKIIAAVAPLLGLLGTVTGMILTFQAITIFGAGDPKAMAGGISGALITTVLGLCVAIPTVLMHTIVNGFAQKIIHVLDEQTTGLVAQHTEGSKNA